MVIVVDKRMKATPSKFNDWFHDWEVIQVGVLMIHSAQNLIIIERKRTKKKQRKKN